MQLRRVASKNTISTARICTWDAGIFLLRHEECEYVMSCVISCLSEQWVEEMCCGKHSFNVASSSRNRLQVRPVCPLVLINRGGSRPLYSKRKCYKSQLLYRKHMTLPCNSSYKQKHTQKKTDTSSDVDIHTTPKSKLQCMDDSRPVMATAG